MIDTSFKNPQTKKAKDALEAPEEFFKFLYILN